MYHILYFFFALTCFYFYRAFTIEIELCESLRFPFLFDNICRVFYWQKKRKRNNVVSRNNCCIICCNTYKVVTIASQSHPQNIDSCLKYFFWKLLKVVKFWPWNVFWSIFKLTFHTWYTWLRAEQGTMTFVSLSGAS